MRIFSMAAVSIALALCAAVTFTPDLLATATFAPPPGDFTTYIAPVLGAAAVDLTQLRAQHQDLVSRAAAKIAEVKDGMAPDAVKKIETEHTELVRQAGEIAAQIAEAEKAPPAPATPGAPETRAHAWTADEIQKIQARAAAFGLDAAAAIAVMGDANVRSLEAATDALQTRAAERNAPRQRPQSQIIRDEGDTIRASVESAILLRANPQALKPDAPERQMARNYRGMSLLEMGRTFVEDTQGVRLRGLTRMELASVLLGIGTRAAGMHSTSDFANLLANVASKRLRAAYEAAPQNWRRISRQSNNPDFKEKSVVQLSSGPAFKLVREGEEYSYGALTDGVEKYALATYGRIITITRQTLINDDLSAFDRLPTLLGRAASELEAKTFWSIFLDNPEMGDGTALFHANHGNLANPGTAIDESALKNAKAAMRKQKSLAVKAADREPLNLEPAFLIVGSDREVEAQKMLTAIMATSAGDVNVFSNSMQLIVDSRIDATNSPWFISADPAVIDTVEYSYLEGEEGVFIEQQIGFDVDGIKIKGRLDFAAKAIDWRGLYKNPGAA